MTKTQPPIPWVALGFLGLNLFIFGWLVGGGYERQLWSLDWGGIAHATFWENPDPLALWLMGINHFAPEHMIPNAAALVVFGTFLEERIGWRSYLALVLIALPVSALAHAIVHPGSTVPLHGASGAVFAAMAAYLTSAIPREVVAHNPRLVWAALLVALAPPFVPVAGDATGTSDVAHLAGIVLGATWGLYGPMHARSRPYVVTSCRSHVRDHVQKGRGQAPNCEGRRERQSVSQDLRMIMRIVDAHHLAQYVGHGG